MSWFSESPPTAPQWGDVIDTGAGRLDEAARAAATLGKAGRRWFPDYLVLALFWISYLAGVSGLVPVLLVSWLLWRVQVHRSRSLDRTSWELATPTAGARRYRTVEVAAPSGLSSEFANYRWWGVVDEDGSPVFGVVGCQTRWWWDRKACIVPAGGSSGDGRRPVPLSPYWTRTATFPGNPQERGYTVLHLATPTGAPKVGVRLADPSDRDVLEVLVYSPELLDEVARDVLSCLAVFRQKVRPGSVAGPLATLPAPAAVPDAPGSWNRLLAGADDGSDGQQVAHDSPGPQWPQGDYPGVTW